MATKKEDESTETVETAVAESADDAKPARFIRGEEVVDAEGKAVEGLSVKNGEIVGKEKS